MDTNIQIREVLVSYQPLKGKLFQVRKSQDAFDYLVQMYDESTIGLYEEFLAQLVNTFFTEKPINTGLSLIAQLVRAIDC